ncbi:hypothetical protein [Caldicellulosiruptor acetigenus]|nr:hypothetical protein [Caldicellulosiruptor acetigenus]
MFFLHGGVNNRIVFNATRNQLSYIASKFYADVDPNEKCAPMVTIATVSQCLEGYKKVFIDPKTRKKVYSKENYFRLDAPITRKELMVISLQLSAFNLNTDDLGVRTILKYPGDAIQDVLNEYKDN